MQRTQIPISPHQSWPAICFTCYHIPLMELEYKTVQPSSRRRHIWLQLTLLIGFILCLILGVGALAALLLLKTEPKTAPALSPLSTIPVDKIAANHALAQLAGDPAKALAYQAVQAGELDLAN